MGCICGKASAIEDSRESPRERQLNKGSSSELHVPRITSSKREESFRVKERLDGGEIRGGLSHKKLNGSKKVRDEHFEKKRENCEVVVPNYHPARGSIPKATEGEQVVAGWPSWLAAVAGEAIKGWVPRRADSFEKLDKIGQGTYSSVYKARDRTQKKIVALKKVRFDSMDPESIKFMAREIVILRRLDHPNIIKLEGLVTSHNSCSLYLVFEYMEHDLTGLASLPSFKFSEPQVKCYMQQLLSGLDHCHSRGVLHRDIKGSNLLIDNHGILKIADFGLASFYDHHQSMPLTSRVVTLWYRPPELLLGATHYGVSVDLWSSGCILGELYAGKPIMPGRTEVEQLHKIFKLCGSPSEDYWRKSKLPCSTVFKPVQPYKRRLVETFKAFPPTAVGLIELLLSIDPAHRGTAASALKNEGGPGVAVKLPLGDLVVTGSSCGNSLSACGEVSGRDFPIGVSSCISELSFYVIQNGFTAMIMSYVYWKYFTTKPLACDPSCLPKYPPSKEIDAKLREEARRREAGGARSQRVNLETGGQKLPQVIPVHNANTELVTSVQGRRGNSHSKSRSELLNHYQEEAASGFPIDPPRHSQAAKEVVGKDRMDHNTKRVSHSGPLAPGVGWTKAGKKYDDMNVISTRADLSTLSGLVASRTSLSNDSRDKLGPSQPKATDQVAKSSESHEVSGSARRTYRKQHTHSITGSHQLEKGRAKEPVLVSSLTKLSISRSLEF
ncbi:hypothetical protein TEA_025433 [Camellia sinensis var. sinensis]|uniref:Protein kinase domain-containing protein n=1 Tax=Camellia sinensis var. sinensis TaxID=542762 RepID=A0A4S4DMA7_CAMSN|nr:hypothetical protein TEA_025433 [Camellia sinensis var. sinensis]